MNNSDPAEGYSMTQSLHELETAAAESGLNLFHVLTQRDLAAAGLPWPVQSPGVSSLCRKKRQKGMPLISALLMSLLIGLWRAARTARLIVLRGSWC